MDFLNYIKIQHCRQVPGSILVGAALHLEERGVLALVPLSALVAGEHGFRVHTPGLTHVSVIEKNIS